MMSKFSNKYNTYYVYTLLICIIYFLYSKNSHSQENINYATEAEEKLIEKGYIFFPPKVIKPKKNSSPLNNEIKGNLSIEKIDKEPSLTHEKSLNHKQKEIETARLENIPENADKINTPKAEKENHIANEKTARVITENINRISTEDEYNSTIKESILATEKIEIDPQKNKLNKRNFTKFELTLGKGSSNITGIRFLSDDKNTFEIIFSNSQALVSNYSFLGSIGGENINLSANTGYDYKFSNKGISINYLREVYENTFLKTGLGFNSIKHNLYTYANVKAKFNDLSATPLKINNDNTINLSSVSPYIGLEYQREISKVGLYLYGNIGIAYTPPSNFNSVSTKFNGLFKSYTKLNSDLNTFRKNVSTYQEEKLYSVGIKYKF